jgi:hypothetical protein
MFAMEIYNVGKDELRDWNFTDIKGELYRWMVYDYVDGGYDGDGTAVAYREDAGLLYCKNLSHCSCYGPLDSWETSCVKMTVEEFLRDKDSIMDYDCKDAIKRKVRELVSKQ